jgi:hypothetical protein
MFHDRCVVVAQSLVVLGWFAMNVVIMVSPAFLMPALAFFFGIGFGVFTLVWWIDNTQPSWPQPHKTPYRLHCCRCARRAAEDWCGLCRMREAGGTCSTDSAQEAAAVVRYSAQPGELRHEPPPETRLTSVETPAHWGRLRFPDSSGRAWKRNDKARTIASLAFSEVTVSAGCKSGEVAYWEVEVVRLGWCLRVGWRRKTNFGGRGLAEWLDCSCARTTGAPGQQVRVRRQMGDYSTTETPWDVSVSEGDVIGLACDLDQGKLSWSLNGDWGTSVSIDLDKV